MSAGKVYVFCNTMDCEKDTGDWHSMVAIAEDGVCLAGHICSHHGYAAYDMGIVENGRKRDLYAAHYPDGFEVVWVPPDAVETHAGLQAAFAASDAKATREAPR